MTRPVLTKVVPAENYEVYLYYDNGEARVYYCDWAREADGYCQALRDISVFTRSCKILDGSLFFDIFNTGDPGDGVVIEAEALYECSVPGTDNR